MLKDITLGQYFSGNSFIHRLDPRIKIIAVFVFAVTIFLAKNLWSFLFITLFSFFLVLLSGISFKIVLKSMKPVMFIIIFTAFINLFFTRADEKPILDFFIFTVYPRGVITAVFMVMRIFSLIMGTSVLLTYTTSPIALTDGLERLMAPLKKIKVPVHDFAMIMTIALRFIPTILEETDRIISAQKARGASFDEGGLIKKAKAFLPIIIPLFVSAFRRADELAVAMECRCYRGDEGRTRMKELIYSKRDFAALALIAVFVLAIVLLNGVPTVISL